MRFYSSDQISIKESFKLLQELKYTLVNEKEINYSSTPWGEKKTTKAQFIELRDKTEGISESERKICSLAFGLPQNIS